MGRKMELARSKDKVTIGRQQAGRGALSTFTVLAFLILGWSGGSVGPALPALAAHWGVRLDEAGATFTMLYLGAGVTIALSSVLLDRFGRQPMLIAGMNLIMLGLA